MDTQSIPASPRKVWAFSGLLAVAMLTLVGRLVFLQVLGVDEFRERADGNRLRVILEQAPRGIIRDRNGVVLAASRLSYSVTLYPIKLSREQTTEVITRLGKLLGLAPDEIRAKWQKAAHLPVRVMQDIDDRTIALIAENQHQLPGVSIEPITIRYYPKGRFASHLLGYTGEITDKELKAFEEEGDDTHRQGDLIGKEGLEKIFDDQLRGQPGRQQVEVDSRGRAIRTMAEIQATPGKDLTLALDAGLQAVAEKELEGKQGAAVCLDPQTGAVLAMVSKPDYDPNLFAGRIRTKDWQALMSATHPMQNRAINAKYPPGSTFKIVTTVAAMEHGIVQETTRFLSNGLFNLNGRVFHDWKPGGFGNVDFHRALVMSIDTVYYELGLRMGPMPMATTARAMGLGQRTGILLPGEEQGVVPDPAWKMKRLHEKWYGGESVNMSIGQGYVLVTPLQNAVMTATVANGGRVVRPKLLLPPAEEEATDPGIQNKWTPATWHMLRSALQEVVDAGTGTAAKIPGHAVAGKTGSAQAPHSTKTHGWFVCYCNDKSPQGKTGIAISVIVETAGHGGSTAAPIANKLLRQWYGLPLEATGSAPPLSGILSKPSTGAVAPVVPVRQAPRGPGD